MKTDKVIEPYYQREGKEFVDFLFDKGFLAKDCSREAMRVLEDYCAYVFQSRVELAIRAHDLTKRLKDFKE